jgi:hypothetical protein
MGIPFQRVLRVLSWCLTPASPASARIALRRQALLAAFNRLDRKRILQMATMAGSGPSRRYSQTAADFNVI